MYNLKTIDKHKIQTIKNYHTTIKIKPIPLLKFKNAKELGVQVKDFLTTGKLIEELSDKITFTDSEKVLADDILKNTNYYRFSIYPKLLPQTPNQKKFTFTDTMDLYNFDNFLRNKLNYFLGHIEKKWRGSLIYSICEQYDSIDNADYYTAQCYLDKTIYAKKKGLQDRLFKFQNVIKMSNSLAIEHHKKNKNSLIPIWVLFEELTFGQFLNFMNGLNRKYIKTYLGTYYNDSYIASLKSWSAHMLELRNKVSHHSRIYGAYFTKKPLVLDADANIFFATEDATELAKLKNSLSASFYIFNKFLTYDNDLIKQKWNIFLDELNVEINNLDTILDIEKNMGLKNNWLNLYKV